MHIEDEELIDTRAAARRLGFSENTLRAWRRDRKGPDYYKIGGRAVRYAVSDLDRFANDGHVQA